MEHVAVAEPRALRPRSSLFHGLAYAKSALFFYIIHLVVKLLLFDLQVNTAGFASTESVDVHRDVDFSAGTLVPPCQCYGALKAARDLTRCGGSSDRSAGISMTYLRLLPGFPGRYIKYGIPVTPWSWKLVLWV